MKKLRDAEAMLNTGRDVAAVLLSLVASAKANHVEPWAWLRDLFTQLPNASAETLDSLLPDRWLKAHPASHWQINDLRTNERNRKRD